MANNLELQSINKMTRFRGFRNLYRKETRIWWRTSRWWINAIFWTAFLGGFTAIMLFISNPEVIEATSEEIAQAGGILGYTIQVGQNIFFEFGMPMLAIGTIILSQDAIIGENQNGITEWLLSKPVDRKSYILAKVAANMIPILVFLVGLPSAAVYIMLSVRGTTPYPAGNYFAAIGIMAIHTIFYLALTLMLGTFFNNRGPILGIALGSVLGGGIIGGFIKQLLYVTPWMLPKIGFMTSSGQLVSGATSSSPIISTAILSIGFVIVAIMKFEQKEF
jgi:ABC-2 type transport system permease protein